jgi:hypothetical protein
MRANNVGTAVQFLNMEKKVTNSWAYRRFRWALRTSLLATFCASDVTKPPFVLYEP